MVADRRRGQLQQQKRSAASLRLLRSPRMGHVPRQKASRTSMVVAMGNLEEVTEYSNGPRRRGQVIDGE